MDPAAAESTPDMATCSLFSEVLPSASERAIVAVGVEAAVSLLLIAEVSGMVNSFNDVVEMEDAVGLVSLDSFDCCVLAPVFARL